MGAVGDVEADESQLHPEQAGVSGDGPDDAEQAGRVGDDRRSS
jgi:hypothetical protein